MIRFVSTPAPGWIAWRHDGQRSLVDVERAAVAGVPIVPAPVRAERREGRPFRLDAIGRVVVGHDPGAVSAGVLLAGRVGQDTGATVTLVPDDDGTPGAIVLRLITQPTRLPVPAGLAPALAAEAYRLEVDAARVVITALDPRGLLRGLATLDQLRVDAPEGVVVPPLLVVDHPRFAWRGLCLDVARHWFGVETLREVVGVLFSLRMNTLHLHLTDDQGWRIETPSRPLLTELSAGTAVDGDPGGYLTRSDFDALTTYAAARGITVVPEVDVPGHVNAALHAYGSLTPSGERRPAYTGVGVGFSRLHAEVADTLPFIADVLGDVAAATPGPYVRIGGDEALTMHAAEYDQLVGHAAAVVAAAGKTVVGWQETVRARLPAGSVVQYWEDREPAAPIVAAAAAGSRVLLSPASRVYLDMKYDVGSPVGSDWAGHIALRRCYDWEPTELVPIPEDQIVGVEAAVWTEGVRTARELFWLLLPRLAAVAEVGWSAPARRTWIGFERRLRRPAAQWDAHGLPWNRPAVAE